MDIDAYVNYLKLRNYTSATVNAYRRELLRFAAFLKNRHLRLTQVRARHVLEYLDAESGQLNWNTVSRKHAVLSAYFDYLRLDSEGRIMNPAKLVRRPRRQPPRPKPADDTVLDTLAAGISNLRDKAILALFRSSGLRLSELAVLDRGSIRIEETVVPFGGRRILGVGPVLGKGRKERDFLVDLETMKRLHAYLTERGEDQLQPLFLSNRGQRMSPRTIEAMLANWCRQLNLPRLHPHAIRHAAATRWYRLGMGTLEISKLLGHSSVAVTDLYLHPDSTCLRAQYFAAMEGLAHRAADSDSANC